jgi:hypothetical protein
LAGLTAATLLLVSGTTALAQPPEDPTVPDANVVITVDAPTITPSPQWHINFILEEHGYDIRVPEPVPASDSCLLVQFRLEEHGYDVDYPCQ